jgi:hypothetical protein
MNASKLAGHGVLLGCKFGDAVHVAIMRQPLKKVGEGFAGGFKRSAQHTREAYQLGF